MNEYISHDLADYVGGNNKIVEESSCDIWICNDKVIMKIGNNSIKVNLKIPFNKIISIETKSQQQISNEVTLGRLLVLGIFAFAFKKEKSNTKYYIVIKYNDKEDKEQYVIYTNTKSKSLQLHFNILNNIYNNYMSENEEQLIIDSRWSLFNDCMLIGNYSEAEDILYEMLDDLKDSKENEYNLIKKDAIQFYVNLLPKSDEELVKGNLPREEVLDGLNYLQTKY